MATNEIHVGDIGTAFVATIKDQNNKIVDISTATSISMIFKKADGKTITFPAMFTTDGRDGKIQYVTGPNDLNVAGNWRVQAKVVLPVGSWSSDIHQFTVYGNL